jgi:hypothetical protein
VTPWASVRNYNVAFQTYHPSYGAEYMRMILIDTSEVCMAFVANAWSECVVSGGAGLSDCGTVLLQVQIEM